MLDRKPRREHVELVAIGPPMLHSGREAAALIGSRVLYALEAPAVSDDARRGRLVSLAVMVDASWLRQLVASARSAGWTE